MECNVSGSAKVKPLLHCGKDDVRILFCRPALVWKEAIAFLHLFFDQPRDLAPLVFEVRNVDLDALVERAAFFFFPFSGIPLSSVPACWDLPREGLRRILFHLGADRDEYF